MKRSMTALTIGALFLGTFTLSFAQDEAQGMPATGPPAEMKQLEAMNGEYKVKFQYKMDPTVDTWTEAAATAVLSTVVGGGAQQLLFEGEMMGMPFTGMGLTTYDRETKQWQTTWVDSMGARISMYTGSFEGGKMVVQGKEKTQGMTFQSRLTTYNITKQGFEWKYEMSMDGTNFMETAKATYTKK